MLRITDTFKEISCIVVSACYTHLATGDASLYGPIVVLQRIVVRCLVHIMFIVAQMLWCLLV